MGLVAVIKWGAEEIAERMVLHWKQKTFYRYRSRFSCCMDYLPTGTFSVRFTISIG